MSLKISDLFFSSYLVCCFCSVAEEGELLSMVPPTIEALMDIMEGSRDLTELLDNEVAPDVVDQTRGLVEQVIKQVQFHTCCVFFFFEHMRSIVQTLVFRARKFGYHHTSIALRLRTLYQCLLLLYLWLWFTCHLRYVLSRCPKVHGSAARGTSALCLAREIYKNNKAARANVCLLSAELEISLLFKRGCMLSLCRHVSLKSTYLGKLEENTIM